MSKFFNQIWYYLLLGLTFVLVIVAIKKLYLKKKQLKEGFSQTTRYVLKRNEDIYDDFYIQAYDFIYHPATYTDALLSAIEQNTQATPERSVFLDIGSKTGKIVRLLSDKGYSAYGVESSVAMNQYTKQYQSTISQACIRGDPADAMLYQRSSFSHILCLHDTIYHFPDKVVFFRNCYFWLKPGGALVLQLLHKILPELPLQTKLENKDQNRVGCKSRIKDPFQRDYKTFTFDNKYESLSTNEVVYVETFRDNLSNNIRENETILYLESTTSIINAALFCRFQVVGKMNLAQTNAEFHNVLYFLERMN